MSASVNAKDLLVAIGHVMRAVPARPSTPEHAAVQLRVGGGELELTGSNGETLTARARVEAAGELLTLQPHGATLADFAKALDGDIELTEGDGGLELRSTRRRFTVHILDEGNYPSTPTQPPAVGTSMGLSEALASVLSSASNDPALVDGALGSVHLEATDGRLTLLATDRFRVSRAVIPWDGLDFSANVQARTLGEFARAMVGTVMTLHINDNLFGLSAGPLSVTMTRMAVEFPMRIATMIDRSRDEALAEDGGLLILPKERLLDTIRALSRALGKNEPLRFRLSAEEGVHVRALTAGSTKDGEDDLTDAAFYDGPDVEVRLQSQFLESVVVGTPSPYIALGVPADVVDERTGAHRLQPVHVGGQATEDAEDIAPGVQHIVMPVRAL